MFFTPSAYYNNRAQTRYRGETSSSLYISNYHSFKEDGTQIYFSQHNNGLGDGAPVDPINTYKLLTPWDASSVIASKGTTTTSKGFGTFVNPITSSIATGFGSVGGNTGHDFSPDGTKVFYSGISTGLIQRFDLSTPWAVETMAINSRSYEYTASMGASIRTIKLSSDGTTMMLLGTSGKLARYTLSSPWNIVGATQVSSVSTGYSTDVTFENGGLYAFTFSGTNLVRRTFATPYDILSTVETQICNFSSFPFVGNVTSVSFKPDGKKGYFSSYNLYNGTYVWAFELEGSYDISGPLIIL